MKAWHRAVLSELPPGARIVTSTRGKHGRVLLADGSVLRDASGRVVVVPCSPGDNRALANTRAAIRRALLGR